MLALLKLPMEVNYESLGTRFVPLSDKVWIRHCTDQTLSMSWANHMQHTNAKSITSANSHLDLYKSTMWREYNYRRHWHWSLINIMSHYHSKVTWTDQYELTRRIFSKVWKQKSINKMSPLCQVRHVKFEIPVTTNCHWFHRFSIEGPLLYE